MLTNQDQPTSAALQVLGQETLDRVLRSPSLHNRVSYMLLDHWALSFSELLKEKSIHPTALALYLNSKTQEVWQALDSQQAIQMQQSGQGTFEILQQLGISIDLPSDL